MSIRFQFRSGKGEAFRIVPIGDLHVGSVGFKKNRLLGWIDYIRQTPNCYWLGIGDLIEGINPSDKRWDIYQIHKNYHSSSSIVTEQCADVVSILKPIVHKCLGFIPGNHEEKVRTQYHIDAHNQICAMLGGVPLAKKQDETERFIPNYLNHSLSAFVELSFVRHTDRRHVVIYYIHGYGTGTTEGGITNRLKRISSGMNADIYLMGHCHKKLAFDTHIIYPLSGKNLVNRVITGGKEGKLLKGELGEIGYKKRLFMSTGTMMEGYPSSDWVEKQHTYAEKMGLPPSSLGFTPIDIIPFKYVSKQKYKTDYHAVI